jgi:hypothetical protein
LSLKNPTEFDQNLLDPNHDQLPQTKKKDGSQLQEDRKEMHQQHDGVKEGKSLLLHY